MIPIKDDNPTLRPPVVTWTILLILIGVWLAFQGAGFDEDALAASVCNWGMLPAELTDGQPIGTAIGLGPNVACLVDDEPNTWFTPITSMFLHGSWSHLLGNALFFWVFGNNIEDSMGRVRFVLFYLLCGLAAAAAHVLASPDSPIPTVGASGAISGVMGAYLVLYPRVRVHMLFIIIIFIRIIPLPAWLVLLWWFGWQVISGLPGLTQVEHEGGVAFWAHVGGFVAGAALIKLFENRERVHDRDVIRHRLHPGHG